MPHCDISGNRARSQPLYCTVSVAIRSMQLILEWPGRQPGCSLQLHAILLCRKNPVSGSSHCSVRRLRSSLGQVAGSASEPSSGAPTHPPGSRCRMQPFCSSQPVWSAHKRHTNRFRSENSDSVRRYDFGRTCALIVVDVFMHLAVFASSCILWWIRNSTRCTGGTSRRACGFAVEARHANVAPVVA